MGIMTKRLWWAVTPALAVACVSVVAASDPSTVKGAKGTSAASSSSASATKTAPGAPRPAGAGGSRVAGASFGTHNTSVLGAAWNVDNSPIKNANLRLRNVVTGKVEALAKANDAGQFAFDNVEGGSYVVELVTEAGRIETVGHVFTIAPGETVATFVRAGARVPWATAFFNNTASSVTSSAATEGVTAIAPLEYCASPPCQQ